MHSKSAKKILLQDNYSTNYPVAQEVRYKWQNQIKIKGKD